MMHLLQVKEDRQALQVMQQQPMLWPDCRALHLSVDVLDLLLWLRGRMLLQLASRELVYLDRGGS